MKHLRLLALGLCACSPSQRAAAPAPQPAPTRVADAVAVEKAPAKPSAPPPSTKDAKEARLLVDEGVRFYRQGQYDEAEERLKQAMTLYPFMADANLALGKILMIRASAARDMTLMTNARLMLEMAHALDPSLRETDVLLELFKRPSAE